MKLAIAVACLLGSPVLGAPASAEPCMPEGLEPVVLTRATAKLPSDGAVIVSEHSTRNAKVPKDPTVWRLASGAAKPATHTELAPGLWRYVPPANALRLENDVWKFTLARTATTPSKLAAPKVKRLSATKVEKIMRSAVLEAELEGNAPAEALAVVVADAKTKQPRSWGYANGPLVRPYSWSKCNQLPKGTVATRPGEDVILYWIDTAGRVSDATAVLRVQ
jgi:hypothetical protein